MAVYCKCGERQDIKALWPFTGYLHLKREGHGLDRNRSKDKL